MSTLQSGIYVTRHDKMSHRSHNVECIGKCINKISTSSLSDPITSSRTQYSHCAHYSWIGWRGDNYFCPGGFEPPTSQLTIYY